MRLWVCCGHGAGDSGAVGGGYTEAERVRALGRRIKELGGDSVVLMDTSRNWYASRGFETVSIPKGDAVVELHMDSLGTTARGAHVIYKAGFAPDSYDRELAEQVSALFPGRAEILHGRSNLLNCNICARRGINYRLVENGFISNATDRAIFNANIDVLARIYLSAFGIASTDKEEEDMTNDQANQLAEIFRQVTRTDDPSGRGVDMNDHDHIKWIAAGQAAQNERLKAIEEKLEKVVGFIDGFAPATLEAIEAEDD
ncbi:MAG TPA: N-acetylmuramoyl-L-alanine amidase [Candidatus Olsenella stercoravium]|uniref:N-acetylmuramoyl-L-alanine amidase n=1 Tax=Candidatus Olsenella stercoravium TaxID=2838713 RepID=A0A9D2DIN7_9ACTN|nr:N-acetylmuramoyl-L-alanine amidase [Candidatus Olsenella stercoravium]